MKKRNKIVYFGAVVLSIAMITASASIVAVTNEEFEKNVKIIKMNGTPLSDSLEVTNVIQFEKIEPSRNGDTQVTSMEEDEFEPAIGVDPDGELLLAYTFEEDMITYNIPWRFSIDGGQTWDPGLQYVIEGVESHPAISYMGVDKRFTGTIQGDPDEGNGAHQYRFLCDDPTDLDTYKMTHWDWSEDYPYADRRIPDIGGYSLPDKPWWYGVIACVGTRDVRVDMPIFNYANYVDENSGWSSYWDTYQGCENAAVDVDLSNGYFYAVFDYLDGSDWDLLVFTGDCHPTDERLTYFDNFLMGDTENTKYPAVGANEDKVIILAQTDEGGNQDIACYYSNDAGETFQMSYVADSGADELYPSIIVYGLRATCTFIKDGDLYYSKTDDGGANWDTPIQLNDENGMVESEFRNVDITTDGTVVWVDDRNDNLDIYLDNVGGGTPPGAPDIDGPTDGIPGTSYDYDFTSTHPDGVDIAEYIVDWGDDTGEETITGPFASGTPATGSHTWAEQGDYNITAKAKDVNGLIGPEGILSVTMPRNRAIMNIPFLNFLENHPILYQLLLRFLRL